MINIPQKMFICSLYIWNSHSIHIQIHLLFIFHTHFEFNSQLNSHIIFTFFSKHSQLFNTISKFNSQFIFIFITNHNSL